MNRHLEVWYAWICETLGVWDTEWVGTLICETSDCVRHLEVWDTEWISMIMWGIEWIRMIMWDTGWISTLICETFECVRHLEVWYAWMCDALGYVGRRMNRHLDMWDTRICQALVWDTEWISMIMWDTEWIGTWTCETLGYVGHLDMWGACVRHWMNRHLEVWDTWICGALNG